MQTPRYIKYTEVMQSQASQLPQKACSYIRLCAVLAADDLHDRGAAREGHFLLVTQGLHQ